jgi:hypothetical protein
MNDSQILDWAEHIQQGQTLQHFSVKSYSAKEQRANKNSARFDGEEVEQIL